MTEHDPEEARRHAEEAIAAVHAQRDVLVEKLRDTGQDIIALLIARPAFRPAYLDTLPVDAAAILQGVLQCVDEYTQAGSADDPLTVYLRRRAEVALTTVPDDLSDLHES